MSKSRRRHQQQRNNNNKKKRRRSRQRGGGGDAAVVAPATARRREGGGGGGRNVATKKTAGGMQCSPQRDGSFTCYSRDELQSIATDLQLPYTRHTSKSELWHQVNDRLSDVCTDEHCWASKVRNGRQIASVAFRPPMSKSMRNNPTQWLSTSDISSVMKQYETAFKGFRFIGPVAIDFMSPLNSQSRSRFGSSISSKCVSEELCRMDLTEWWRQGVRQIGVVFNMDAHDMPGSHWVALHCSLVRNEVCYYDSYGVAPCAEIYALIDRLVEQSGALHKLALGDANREPMKVRINSTRHQFRNTECGVYAMYFLMHMTEGMDFDTFTNEYGLTDAQVNRYRSYFYNTYA